MLGDTNTDPPAAFLQPTRTAAWQTLQALAATTRARWSPELIDAAGLTLDISRQHLDGSVTVALHALLGEMNFEARRAAFLAGEAVNTTEQRAALHPALRDSMSRLGGSARIGVEVRQQLAAMTGVVAKIRNGQWRSIADRVFTDAVVIGIGGSALGPELVCRALTRATADTQTVRVHFVANIDGAAIDDTLNLLDAARTLIVVVSKTFTTAETMANARAAKAWLCAALGESAFAQQSIAVTARPDEAARQGYGTEQVLRFWDSIGGRFSLWSTVGLPIALAHGMEKFVELLSGAQQMDEHFASAPVERNLPITLALLGVWNRNFLSMPAHAVLPYAQRLSLLPKHLQQLEMESTGKSVDLNGHPVDYATCPVIFGEAGTNGQHSFHQLLHQGSDALSADVIIVKEAESAQPGHHATLCANAFAQADALWHGLSAERAYATLSDMTNPAERQRQAQHRVHAGGRPVSLIEMPRLDARHLGALIAAYEHKVFTQAVLWNVNPFDQFGVELGKVIARSIEGRVKVALNTSGARSLLSTLAHV